MESYSLAHYFAARHTSCDSFTKRNKKGLLITVGDEPNHKSYSKHSIAAIFGDNLESDITSTKILDEAKEGWEVYHININDYDGRSASCKNSWKSLLGDHVIDVEANDDANVSNVIAALAIKVYNEQYGSSSASSEVHEEAPQQML